MKRIAFVLFAVLAAAPFAEAARKPLACTVYVEIKDAVDTSVTPPVDTALIHRVTNHTSHCEFTGKVKFIVNNNSDINVTVMLKNFLVRTGGVCTAATIGSPVNLPLDGFSDVQMQLNANASGEHTRNFKIKGPVGPAECYKFDVWLYPNPHPGWIYLDHLDPDLEIGPPSGPPPPMTPPPPPQPKKPQ